ncbi:glutamate receptor ionotropic, partial [Leptotrombidium deliense]
MSSVFINASHIRYCDDASEDIIRVTTIFHKPYVTIINDPKRPLNISEINETHLEGYLIDLIRHLAALVQFKYTIHLVKDSSYGHWNGERWNGMIGEILRNEADLALADLTITSERERVVDFSYPYLTTAIGLLAIRPPYYEHSGEQNTTDSFSKKRTMFIYPVNSITDLIEQNEVKFGALQFGSTLSYFTNSRDATHKRIGEIMMSNKTSLSKSHAEGIERVKNSNGKYVFFIGKTIIEYQAGIDCDLMQLGNDIAGHSLGFAMPINYHLKTKINLGLL